MFLSFAELGIGAALSYSFYKPIANADHKAITAITNLYRKIYNTIGWLILILGLLLAYFVPFLVKNSGSIKHLRIYFILFLLSSVVSYFFTYNRSLIVANQESYIDSINQLIFTIMKCVLQIVFLITLKSYMLFLVAQIATNLFSNFAITRLAHKKYPFLLDDKKIMPGKSVITEIKKNVIGTISSKVGAVVVNGTDNILISKFVGLSVVGLYSNYSLVVAGITSLLGQVLNSVVASFGNLGVSEKDNIDKQVNLFNQFVFFNGFISIVVGLLLYILFQPFISMWIGTQYKLSEFTLIIIIINFVFAQFRPALFLVNAYGLFWGYRYKSIVEATVNFFLSFYLVKYTGLGINGVLIGTIVGNIIVNSWWDPMILFTGAFHRGIFKFYLQYIYYIFVFLGMLLCEFMFVHYIKINVNNLIGLILYGLSSSIIICIILLGLLGLTPGGRSALSMILYKIKKIK
ncbi:lipopolysaccharide biosynthesis protein [Latilactobacillus sakei]|uniref:lipopolysaccharide biosynthesis protein n=1 Tax=Latilactobacillus sakei TaxID=1599 RepID=UPI0020730C8D|nr:transporter [Latilactobacillus sakei]USG02933.1 hypothetical protein A4W86_07840 [Latilactobacillus sakei]